MRPSGLLISISSDAVAADGRLIALGRDPRVKFVEEDGVVSASTTQPNAPWGLDRIDRRDLRLDTNYTYANTGAGVHAYVLDCGIQASRTDFGWTFERVECYVSP